MNEIHSLFVILVLAMATSSCRAQICDLKGNWEIKRGFPAGNFGRAKPYSENRIRFSADTVELASGFFYNTINWDEDKYPQGRYPFVYYGNREKYRVQGDSLHIYSKPYKNWNSFKLSCVESKTIKLIGKNDTILLCKVSQLAENSTCSIRYIKAHIQDGDLSLFKNNYKVIFTNDNSLFYEGPNAQGENIRTGFNLKPGTFNDICAGFRFVDVKRLKPLYKTEVSEINNLALEIGLMDGQVIKTDIQNLNCPDQLRLALVPVLYTHQLYVYPNLNPVKY